MSIKAKILRILEESGDSEVSGQALADSLKVSRTAVWNAVNALKNEGCKISASTNRGYKLIASCDLLTSETVSEYLSGEYSNFKICVLKSVDSTNNLAKKMAAEGAKNGTVIIAEEQTAGRGRRGNTFCSPLKSGLYMSVILKTSELNPQTDLYTVCAGCAVCRAVERLTDKKPLIKWVNDVYTDGGKLCGILCEATADMETGHIESVVVGIGINLSIKAFPEEIKNKASELGSGVLRSRLAAAVIEELFACLKKDGEENIKDYKKRSLVLNKEVSFIKNGKAYSGMAVDIDPSGRLEVLTDEGRLILNSGEISLTSWG